MSDEMERWDFTDNENGCDAMVSSEDGEFVEYAVAMRRIRELERQLADRDASWERAIREYFDCDEAVQAVAAERERLEAEGGGA